MTPAELNYLSRVYTNMTGECMKSLNDLVDIITDNGYAMKDSERIHRIDNIYTGMKDKYAFTQSFTSEAAWLSLQRQNDLSEVDFLQSLY